MTSLLTLSPPTAFEFEASASFAEAAFINHQATSATSNPFQPCCARSPHDGIAIMPTESIRYKDKLATPWIKHPPFTLTC